MLGGRAQSASLPGSRPGRAGRFSEGWGVDAASRAARKPAGAVVGRRLPEVRPKTSMGAHDDAAPFALPPRGSVAPRHVTVRGSLLVPLHSPALAPPAHSPAAARFPPIPDSCAPPPLQLLQKRAHVSSWSGNNRNNGFSGRRRLYVFTLTPARRHRHGQTFFRYIMFGHSGHGQLSGSEFRV